MARGIKMKMIDTDKAYEVLTNYYHHETVVQHITLQDALGKIPAVDAVRVIRCKDCQWYMTPLCSMFNSYKLPPGDNDFCSFGEQRR